MYRYILAFGSNMGDKHLNFDKALQHLLSLEKKVFLLLNCGKRNLIKPFLSDKYDTSKHEDYLNFVCEISSSLDPYTFYLKIIVPIEDELGHSRQKKWEPRCLDIDILFAAYEENSVKIKSFESCQLLYVEENDFIVPHKDFFNRPEIMALVVNDLGINLEKLKQRTFEKETHV